MSFSSDVDAWTKKAKALLKQFQDETATEVGKRIINRTPVKTGAARAHWNAIGRTFSPRFFDKNGQPTTARLRNEVSGHPLGAKIRIENPAPYATRLEYGWSKQAPSGMVRVTAAEWPGIVDAAVRKLAK